MDEQDLHNNLRKGKFPDLTPKYTVDTFFGLTQKQSKDYDYVDVNFHEIREIRIFHKNKVEGIVGISVLSKDETKDIIEIGNCTALSGRTLRFSWGRDEFIEYFKVLDDKKKNRIYEIEMRTSASSTITIPYKRPSYGIKLDKAEYVRRAVRQMRIYYTSENILMGIAMAISMYENHQFLKTETLALIEKNYKNKGLRKSEHTFLYEFLRKYTDFDPFAMISTIDLENFECTDLVAYFVSMRKFVSLFTRTVASGEWRKIMNQVCFGYRKIFHSFLAIASFETKTEEDVELKFSILSSYMKIFDLFLRRDPSEFIAELKKFGKKEKSGSLRTYTPESLLVLRTLLEITKYPFCLDTDFESRMESVYLIMYRILGPRGTSKIEEHPIMSLLLSEEEKSSEEIEGEAEDEQKVEDKELFPFERVMRRMILTIVSKDTYFICHGFKLLCRIFGDLDIEKFHAHDTTSKNRSIVTAYTLFCALEKTRGIQMRLDVFYAEVMRKLESYITSNIKIQELTKVVRVVVKYVRGLFETFIFSGYCGVNRGFTNVREEDIISSMPANQPIINTEEKEKKDEKIDEKESKKKKSKKKTIVEEENGFVQALEYRLWDKIRTLPTGLNSIFDSLIDILPSQQKQDFKHPEFLFRSIEKAGHRQKITKLVSSELCKVYVIGFRERNRKSGKKKRSEKMMMAVETQESRHLHYLVSSANIRFVDDTMWIVEAVHNMQKMNDAMQRIGRTICPALNFHTLQMKYPSLKMDSSGSIGFVDPRKMDEIKRIIKTDLKWDGWMRAVSCFLEMCVEKKICAKEVDEKGLRKLMVSIPVKKSKKSKKIVGLYVGERKPQMNFVVRDGQGVEFLYVQPTKKELKMLKKEGYKIEKTTMKTEMKFFSKKGHKIKAKTKKYKTRVCFVQYVGQFRDNEREGHGTEFIRARGKGTLKVYEGQWKNGMRDGQGMLFVEKRRVLKVPKRGVWKNGKFVKELRLLDQFALGLGLGGLDKVVSEHAEKNKKKEEEETEEEETDEEDGTEQPMIGNFMDVLDVVKPVEVEEEEEEEEEIEGEEEEEELEIDEKELVESDTEVQGEEEDLEELEKMKKSYSQIFGNLDLYIEYLGKPRDSK